MSLLRLRGGEKGRKSEGPEAPDISGQLGSHQYHDQRMDGQVKRKQMERQTMVESLLSHL